MKTFNLVALIGISCAIIIYSCSKPDKVQQQPGGASEELTIEEAQS